VSYKELVSFIMACREFSRNIMHFTVHIQWPEENMEVIKIKLQNSKQFFKQGYEEPYDEYMNMELL
jgi:hypothetical protein